MVRMRVLTYEPERIESKYKIVESPPLKGYLYPPLRGQIMK
jgi:hypothetical protein